jgi:hypothetical protein
MSVCMSVCLSIYNFEYIKELYFLYTCSCRQVLCIFVSYETTTKFNYAKNEKRKREPDVMDPYLRQPPTRLASPPSPSPPSSPSSSEASAESHRNPNFSSLSHMHIPNWPRCKEQKDKLDRLEKENLAVRQTFKSSLTGQWRDSFPHDSTKQVSPYTRPDWYRISINEITTTLDINWFAQVSLLFSFTTVLICSTVAFVS